MTHQEIATRQKYHERAAKLLSNIQHWQEYVDEHPTSEAFKNELETALKDWKDFNEGSSDIYDVADHPTN
jgi:uncharacterized membrane-anchored protein YhcB (DUF1043 family)